MRYLTVFVLPLTLFALLATGCDAPTSPESDDPVKPFQSFTMARTFGAMGPPSIGEDTYSFPGPIFDIEATPNGNLFVTQGATVKEISKRGIVDVATVPAVEGSPVNGLGVIGQGNFFATSGGLDLAEGAGVWRVSRGNARLVGDIEMFEKDNDPDASEGPMWKDPRCEVPAGFSAGPQSNPYHLEILPNRVVLVGDAAGNTVLSVSTKGDVELVALLTPPVKAGVSGSASTSASDWMVLFPLGVDDVDCYVQPVPTSVAVGADGAYYVGELTGVTPADFTGGLTTDLSRIWRVSPGVRNVTCPSSDCQVVASGLTSVVDLAVGPDEKLYAVELDANGWFAATVLGNSAGGVVKRCESGTCSPVFSSSVPLAALTFDKDGTPWVAENDFTADPFAATTRPVSFSGPAL